jgi:HAD superfamily hydrolase (TIGR01549 family)
MKYIIFDFDGTIADTFESAVKIYNAFAAKHNLVKISNGKELRDVGMREWIKYSGISKINLWFLIREEKRKINEKIPQIKIFPSLKNILQKLSKKYELGIITSNSKENVEKFLKKNKVDNAFSFILSDTSLFGKHKTLAKLIKKRGYDKRNLIYVADEVRDIEAARKIGIKIVSVDWGWNSKQRLKEEHPDCLIEKPNELLKILKV